MSDLAGRFDEMPAAARAGLAFGLGIAAAVTTAFGFVWFGWALGTWNSTPFALWIALYAATLVLLALEVRAIRGGRILLNRVAPGDNSYRRSMGPKFGLITAAEGVGCGIVVVLCSAFHRMDLLAVGISLVVGLHFIPLARIFRFPAHYWTAACIILADILTVSFFKADAQTIVVGAATGGILWASAIYALSISSAARSCQEREIVTPS